jgi:hypothetical protein
VLGKFKIQKEEAVSQGVRRIKAEIGGRHFVLMDYVDADVLVTNPRELSREEKDERYFKMGTTLQKMHSSKAEGYGPIENGRAQFTNFKDWLLKEDHIQRINNIKDLGLLTEEHGSLDKAIAILNEYAEKFPESNYCHFDFADYNILDTDPYTVIDPAPTFVPGIIDVGRSNLIIARTGDYDSVKKFNEGYFSEDRPQDERALQATVLFNAYIKFNYWHKMKRLSHIEHVQKYLIENRSKLE